MRGTRLALLCLGTSLALGATARADEAAATDQFLNFVSNGCIGSIGGGASVSVFAKQQEASLADEKFAGTVLGTDKGTVYFKADPMYPLAIAERASGPCTVHAKFPADLTGLVAAVEDFFGGPGGGFYPVRVFEEDAGAAGWTTHRVYVGQRRGKKFTLLFSTTPGAATLDQIMFAALETKP
jgi:hypothetical protein